METAGFNDIYSNEQASCLHALLDEGLDISLIAYPCFTVEQYKTFANIYLIVLRDHSYCEYATGDERMRLRIVFWKMIHAVKDNRVGTAIMYYFTDSKAPPLKLLEVMEKLMKINDFSQVVTDYARVKFGYKANDVKKAR